MIALNFVVGCYVISAKELHDKADIHVRMEERNHKSS